MTERKWERSLYRTSLAAIMSMVLAGGHETRADQIAAALPAGVKAVWDLDKAYRETTPTRERICINGLWRWQPAETEHRRRCPPASWGYFKVPGCWPGITDYMQKDCQTVYPHPSWKDVRLAGVTAAWYQREITVPSEWAGRRIAVSAEYLNSYRGRVSWTARRRARSGFPAARWTSPPPAAPAASTCSACWSWPCR